MPTIKTYRKVGAFYIAWEEDFSTSIRIRSISALFLGFAELSHPQPAPTEHSHQVPSAL